MTVHIGTMGQPRPAIDADFEWFGATIRVHPDASDLAYAEFLAIARQVQTDASGLPTPGMEQRAAEVVDDMLRNQVHPDDFADFMRIAKANRQTILDLMAVSQRIISAVSGFPTGQPSDSPTGVSGGTDRSPVPSSDRGSRRKQARKEAKRQKKDRLALVHSGPVTAHERAVAMAAASLSARPDLQLMVLRREEEISAASA